MGFSSFPISLLVFLLSLFPLSATSQQQPPLPAAEQEAVYHVLESINHGISWRTLYPDDLCYSGPHGVVCDLFPDANGTLVPHISELNFGYVSDFNPNPPCGDNPFFSPRLSSSFPFLRKLFFYRCFTGANTTALPACFWNLTRSSPMLEQLVFVENPSLVGHLSGRIGGFTRLRRLIVSGTRISGDIPDEIGELLWLEELVLSRCRLHGEIPSTVRFCSRLRILDLSGNRFGGPMPAEIGHLTELLKLDLRGNRISGVVPAEFSRLQKVEFLDLSRNNLTGGVPTSLAEMGSLKEVYLSGNERLGGQIPEIWENMRGIMGIGMSGLGLVGGIPESMGLFLGNLCYLAMDNNFLDGEVPEEFRRLELTAREINLENNLLQGRIPFSTGFVEKVGGKLKLGGNRNLCWDDGFGGGGATEVGMAGFGFGLCNKTQIPNPVVFSSFSGASASASAAMVPTPALFLVLLLCFAAQRTLCSEFFLLFFLPQTKTKCS